MIAVLVLGLALAACGGSSGSDTSGGEAEVTAEESGEGEVTAEEGEAGEEAEAGGGDAELEAALDKGYAGVFGELPKSGPKAVSGKNVWYISCGEAFVACAEMSAAFKEAGEVLGWHVTVGDSKASPPVANNLIKQAVAAHADGIVIGDSDCPGVKSALLAAKAADIPTVNYASLDCNDPDYGEGEGLFTASIKLLGSTDQGKYFEEWGKARADYLLGKLEGKGGKILSIGETSQLIQRHAVDGFEKEIEAKCDNCELVKVPFTFAQVPAQSTPIFQNALLQNPDAAALSFNLDTLMALGLQTALQQHPNPDMLVVGGEGFPVNWPLIREGLQTASIGFPYISDTWGEADVMNRLFAGEDPETLPDEGGGYQYIDKEHNLPEEEEPFVGVPDYKEVFTKIWTGK